MRDSDCVEFLQWCLPHLGLRWPGFRKVRRMVCKRLGRRLAALDLHDLHSYRAYIEKSPAEWEQLDEFCRIPISQFWRDHGIFEFLASDVLPTMAQAVPKPRGWLRCWSLGCASGEEPFSLVLLWLFKLARRFPHLRCAIMATDVDPVLVGRAAKACYPSGSLWDLPADLRAVFVTRGDQFCLPSVLRANVTLRCQDVRTALPTGRFDLILCRNLVFTYFSEELQARTLAQLVERLRSGGALVIGKHETLPATKGLIGWRDGLGIYRRD
jgi:chemotaxis protein methyltransferase CheR